MDERTQAMARPRACIGTGRLSPFTPGTVRLVGGGPGDPGLLTVHALLSLQQADVVLYDALIDDAVLAEVSVQARLEDVGKRGYGRAVSQDETIRRLIGHARAGRRVVRLKGGDPFMFGRGGEEAERLVAAGVSVSVVPGITAGVAALAAAGMAVTSRDTNSAVTFATGHFADGAQDRIDWESLARLGQPIVFYMAVRNLSRIADALIGAGLARQTPVLVVSHGTTARQTVLRGDIGNIAALAVAERVRAPAVVAVGANVRTRDRLIDGLAPLSYSPSGCAQ